MKTFFKHNIYFLVISLFFLSCSVAHTANIDHLLNDSKGWTVQTIDKGLVHYELPSRYVEELKSYQNVNVLAVDLKKSDYKILFHDIDPKDSLSAAAIKVENAVGGINGTYYEKETTGGYSTSYFKSQGKLIDSVGVKPYTQLGWKHEGAFYIKNEKPGIIRGSNKIYNNLEVPDLISGSPVFRKLTPKIKKFI